MIHDIQNGSATGGGRRVLAVIGDRADRAREVAEKFDAEGDAVEAVWYSDSRGLIEADGRPAFDAVIFFAPPDAAAGDEEEAALRGALRDTPVYRVSSKCEQPA